MKKKTKGASSVYIYIEREIEKTEENGVYIFVCIGVDREKVRVVVGEEGENERGVINGQRRQRPTFK